MKILKFEAATMRDALTKVKAELGDQAVVVSARQIPRGLLGSAYEIAVAVDGEDDDTPPARSPRGYGSYTATAEPARAAVPAERDLDHLMAPLRSELRSLRAMVRAASEPRVPSELRHELGALRSMVEALQERAPAILAPEGSPRAPRSADEIDARALTCASLARIIMLVGPTGVGKTTTIAKLAARAALVEGRQVGLITLDSYRVGGVTQIQTFADLIGVPLEIADQPNALPDLLSAWRDFDLVLVDTAGRSPLDLPALEDLAEILMRCPAIEVHLVINADAPIRRLDDVARRYASLRPSRLLFTKLDEVDEVPELALAPARLGLPITWITTGQAVPEDIEEPTHARVLELAVTGLATGPARGQGTRRTAA